MIGEAGKAALTLLPALLAIVGRAAFWPSRTARSAGRPGWWGRTAGRVVAHPAATLAFGLVAFGALATAVLGYSPAGLGSTPADPADSDSAAGGGLLDAHFPAAAGNPTTVVLRFREPTWNNPAPAAAAEARLGALPQFASLTGPLDVNGVTLTPAQLTALHATLGSRTRCPPCPGAASRPLPGPPIAPKASSSALTAGPFGSMPP